MAGSVRVVPWLTAMVYGVVLASGLYHALIRQGASAAGTAVFALVMVVLFALEAVAPRMPSTRTAVLVLVLRVALFAVAAATDGSGLSRALFVLVPFTAYLAFGRRVGLALAVAGLVLMVGGFTVLTPGWHTDLERVADLLMFVIGLVLAIAMAGVARAEQQARVRLADSHERVAQLSAAAERNRMARDIHDSLGHHLTAVSVQLEKAEVFRDRDADAAGVAIAEARSAARRALADVRRSVRTLRVPTRLPSALGELVDDGPPAVTLAVRGDERDVDESVAAALYRIAQESVTNARRHARARRVRITLAFDDAGVRVEVADDGCGMPAGADGFGLLGMRERAELAGGDLRVRSTPGTGTTVTAAVPG